MSVLVSLDADSWHIWVSTNAISGEQRMGLNDIRGVPTSSDSQASLDRLEEALDLAIIMRGDPVVVLDAALDAEPGFVLGLCLRAEMQLLTTERSRVPMVARDVELAEALTGTANNRERGHIAAIRAWLEGNMEKSTECWETILLDQITCYQLQVQLDSHQVYQ